MNYVLEPIDLDGFDILAVKLTHESLFDFIEELEAEDLIGGSGQMVIDQLLSTGNAKNRFVAFPVTDGKFELEKARAVEASSDLEKETAKIYREYSSFLENSILSEEERSAILG